MKIALGINANRLPSLLRAKYTSVAVVRKVPTVYALRTATEQAPALESLEMLSVVPNKREPMTRFNETTCLVAVHFGKK